MAAAQPFPAAHDAGDAVEEFDRLLHAAGELKSGLIVIHRHRLTDAAVSAMRDLVGRLEAIETAERYRAALRTVAASSDGVRAVADVKLSKYLRGSTASEHLRREAVDLGKRLLAELVRVPALRNFSQYVLDNDTTNQRTAFVVARDFVDTLNLDAADASAAAPAAAAGRALATRTVQTPCILWVDDNHAEGDHAGIAEAAREKGVNVELAGSVEEARTFLRAHSRFLVRRSTDEFRIITDMQHDARSAGEEELPSAGFRVWNLVRRELFFVRTPILVYTGHRGVERAHGLLDTMSGKHLRDKWIRITCDPEPCFKFASMSPLEEVGVEAYQPAGAADEDGAEDEAKAADA